MTQDGDEELGRNTKTGLDNEIIMDVLEHAFSTIDNDHRYLSMGELAKAIRHYYPLQTRAAQKERKMSAEYKQIKKLLPHTTRRRGGSRIVRGFLHIEDRGIAQRLRLAEERKYQDVLKEYAQAQIDQKDGKIDKVQLEENENKKTLFMKNISN